MVAEEPISRGPFRKYLDYSKLNTGRHDASRSDTFSTPSRLDKPFNVPSRLDKRWGLGDTRDLFDVLEQVFAKSIRNLGKEIQGELQKEQQEATELFHQEVKEMLVAHETTSIEILMQILEKISQKSDEPLNVDFSSIEEMLRLDREELRSGELLRWDAHKDLMQCLEGRLTKNVLQVLDETHTVRRQQEQAESVRFARVHEEIDKAQLQADMEEVLRRSEAQLEKVANLQQGLSANSVQTLKELHKMHQENARNQADLLPCLDAQLSKLLREQAVNVDFAPVTSQIGKSQQSVNEDFATVFAEIAKVQQALNVDFSQVLDEIGEMGKLHQKEPEEPTVPRPRKRVREYWAQTDGLENSEGWTQTDEALLKPRPTKPRCKTERKSVVASTSTNSTIFEIGKSKPVFADAETMKKNARMAYVQLQYNVHDLYHEEGFAQMIARSWVFEGVTFSVITLNAVWIAVDTDYNDAAMLIDAHPVFQVVENLFCSYFTFELVVRFAAFVFKRDCLKDAWFLFDTVLFILMISETWVVTVIMLVVGSSSSASVGDVSILRMARMIKMCRLARMARTLR